MHVVSSITRKIENDVCRHPSKHAVDLHFCMELYFKLEFFSSIVSVYSFVCFPMNNSFVIQKKSHCKYFVDPRIEVLILKQQCLVQTLKTN